MELFDGNKKVNTSILSAWEHTLVAAMVPKVPRFLNGINLTLLSLLWSALVIWFSYQAVADIRWLWAASGIIVLHWLTDSLDGAVGRYRNSGLVRWGFYFDHLLDFVLTAAVFIGYALLVDASALFALFIFFVACTIIPVSIFFSFSAYQALKIGSLGFGPTEYRIAIILLNTAIIYFGISWFERALPYFALLLFVYAFLLVYRTQRDMYRMDMRDRK